MSDPAAVPEQLEEAIRFGGEECHKDEHLELGVVSHSVNPREAEASRFLCEFKASLTYLVNSRLTRATW